jgi:nonribosomal peptide synthetase DhbF
VVVTPGATPSVEEVRAHLAAELPPYMIPSAFVVLPALPLTSSGKVDRARLPQPSAQAAAQFVEPSTTRNAGWSRSGAGYSAAERIGVHDNFFGLGGNSLQATQLVSRIRDAFSITIDLRTLFTNCHHRRAGPT